jgi:hypothetical protein
VFEPRHEAIIDFAERQVAKSVRLRDERVALKAAAHQALAMKRERERLFAAARKPDPLTLRQRSRHAN